MGSQDKHAQEADIFREVWDTERSIRSIEQVYKRSQPAT